MESIHWFLFQPEAHAGKFRQINVQINFRGSSHIQPDWEIVPKLIWELQQRYRGKIG